MHRNIKLLALFNFFIEFSFYYPIAIIYFSRVSGSYALGMSIFSLTMLSSALFEVPTGVFSDFIGRKRTITLGAISATLAVTCYAVGGSYGMLALGAILEGLGRSFFSGNNDAFLHDVLSESQQQHKYHEFLGKISSVEQMGLAIVAILGSILANWSFALVMWLSVVPKLFNVAISLFFTETKGRSQGEGNIFSHLRGSMRYFWDNKKLRLLSINSMIGYSLGESSYFFRGIFVNTLWPIWAIGFVNAFSNVGAAFSFFFSGKIINKFGFKKPLLFEVFYNRIANLSALIFPTILSPFIMSTTSITYGIGTTAKNTLLQHEFSSGQRATLGSLNSLFGSILFAGMSMLLGFVADKTSPRDALIYANILLLVPLWFYHKIFSIKK